MPTSKRRKPKPNKSQKMARMYKKLASVGSRLEFIIVDSKRNENDVPIMISNAPDVQSEQVIIHQKRDWFVCAGVICKDEAGDYYTEEVTQLLMESRIASQFESPHPHGVEVDRNYKLVHSLIESCNRRVNPKHVIDYCYVVKPLTQRLLDAHNADISNDLFHYWNKVKVGDIKKLERFMGAI